ncbi:MULTISPECIES: hypothetical protein [Sutcliffiella]|uniref:DUF2642 domain-containing protein n=1 Tax=Sutcliffiella cohnii TaxID=33932 RepID=A0A223KMF1_9BACI|nr:MULTISPECIES: hypothetical protein [Sutcliffiella]AST90642.1 hypothetical protein BC6307_04775 [Sutcliffiella cohnii]MED4016930.1 hypothetical protein [Sutcliffiella cohnii]WBL16294.1 hypothetical protein O1A01_06590 [Sutcliffiella sp. NC1]
MHSRHHVKGCCSTVASLRGCDPDTVNRKFRRRVLLAEMDMRGYAARLARLEQAIGPIIPGPTPPAPGATLRQYFLNNLGSTVSITATIGPVSGVVTRVGVDSVEIISATGDVFIIPFTSVLAV